MHADLLFSLLVGPCMEFKTKQKRTVATDSERKALPGAKTLSETARHKLKKLQKVEAASPALRIGDELESDVHAAARSTSTKPRQRTSKTCRVGATGVKRETG